MISVQPLDAPISSAQVQSTVAISLPEKSEYVIGPEGQAARYELQSADISPSTAEADVLRIRESRSLQLVINGRTLSPEENFNYRVLSKKVREEDLVFHIPKGLKQAILKMGTHVDGVDIPLNLSCRRPTLGDLIGWYAGSILQTRQRRHGSHRQLVSLTAHPLARKVADKLTAAALVHHAQERRGTGTSPLTIAEDFNFDSRRARSGQIRRPHCARPDLLQGGAQTMPAGQTDCVPGKGAAAGDR